MEHCTCVLPIDLLTFIITRPENEECGGYVGLGWYLAELSWLAG